MEKILRHLFLILAITGNLAIQAQDATKQLVRINPADETTSVTNPSPATDPKLPPIPGIGQTGSNNPAKPPAMSPDMKIPNLELTGKLQSGSTNSKPQAEPQKDPKLNTDGTLPHSNQVPPLIKTQNKSTTSPVKGTREQPQGAKPDSITNYRNIKGPAAQPIPAKPAKVINYRELKGPRTQPSGEVPKR